MKRLVASKPLNLLLTPFQESIPRKVFDRPRSWTPQEAFWRMWKRINCFSFLPAPKHACFSPLEMHMGTIAPGPFPLPSGRLLLLQSGAALMLSSAKIRGSSVSRNGQCPVPSPCYSKKGAIPHLTFICLTYHLIQHLVFQTRNSAKLKNIYSKGNC